MQHQYWSLRRSVLRSLGGKEDECVVASDAELDAKLELFRSISDSCVTLQRVLDQYQERLCILAQEESATGKFLRDAGRGDRPGGEEGIRGEDAAAKHMLASGKAISYSGQQRLTMRGPLLRMYHEVETFRGRAVSDTRATVSAMEKARGEYRAALSWMKAASAQLDPDTDRGLDKFRKAQRHVRCSKQLFDKLTLDVLQKIDLLAAARCNMFSHVLSNYQTSFSGFANKVHQTLVATSATMNAMPKYDFCILKELSQKLEEAPVQEETMKLQDKDQMLFFQDEYKDEKTEENEKSAEPNRPEKSTTDSETVEIDLLAPHSDLVDVSSAELGTSSELNSDLTGLRMDCGDLLSNLGSFMPSQLLQDSSSLMPNLRSPLAQKNGAEQSSPSQSSRGQGGKSNDKKSDMSAWFKIFAELDPLANPDSIPGSHTHQSHAA